VVRRVYPGGTDHTVLSPALVAILILVCEWRNIDPSRTMLHGMSGIAAYLRESLNTGRLILTAASLHGNAGQSGGVYPIFYTSDSLLSDGPLLEIEVRLYGAEETITISSVLPTSPTARAVRFPSGAGQDFGVRWTEDFKNWFPVDNPVLTNPEAGVSEWVDDDAEAGRVRFYQVYLKP